MYVRDLSSFVLEIGGDLMMICSSTVSGETNRCVMDVTFILNGTVLPIYSWIVGCK